SSSFFTMRSKPCVMDCENVTPTDSREPSTFAIIPAMWSRWIQPLIAVLALIQPWIIWLYRKYGRGGDIDVHHTGNVEVGFSALGATVGLQGTLRAADRDFFVSSMTLEVLREADGSRHTLEWGAFRPPAVVVGVAKD